MNKDNYNEIIEMEVLSGIDRALHVLLIEYKNNLLKGLNVFDEYPISELKERLPKYIDEQYKTIILENLSDSVCMFPPVSE